MGARPLEWSGELFAFLRGLSGLFADRVRFPSSSLFNAFQICIDFFFPRKRVSMGTGSANYMNLDNGIEQARHRLATLAMVERPHMIIANATEEPLKPTPHSTKKSRTLLLALTLIDVFIFNITFIKALPE